MVAGIAFLGSCCGPGIFLLLAIVVYLFITLPWILYSAEPPSWMAPIAAMLGALLTGALFLSVVIAETRKRKRKSGG